jgi:hypothetical protein
MKRLINIFSMIIFLASCVQESIESAQQITGLYALDNGTGLTNEYIKFDKGKLSDFISKESFPLAENHIWDNGEAAFRIIGFDRYSIKDGIYTTSSNTFSNVSIAKDGDDGLIFGSKSYVRLAGFKKEPYSSIHPEKDVYENPLLESEYSFPVTVKNPIPTGKLTANSSSSWISGIVVRDGRLHYKLSSSKTPREGKITLSYTHSVVVPVTIRQAPATFIRLYETSKTIGYAGSSIEILYTIENPLPGAVLAVASSADWIEDITVTSDKVTFNVPENNSGAPRTMKLTFSYDGAEDTQFSLTQDWSAVSIILTPDSVTHDYSSFTGSFTFEVQNPRDNTSCSVDSQSPWIYNVALTENRVCYEVLENENQEQRFGTIKVQYGPYAETSFHILQLSAVTTLELSPSSQVIPCSSEQYSFRIIVHNPRSGHTLSASSSEDWISDIIINEDIVQFFVSENISAYPRSGRIIVGYGEGYSAEFFLTQKGAPISQMILNKTSLSLVVGETETLTAYVVPSDVRLIWSSSNPDIAKVDEDGVVVALEIGNTVISVSSEDKSVSASCLVTVSGNENSLALSSSWTVGTGLTYGTQGIITISNPTGGALSIASSPDPSIAIASDINSNRLTITPVSSGETSITIKSAATANYAEASRIMVIKIIKAVPSFAISPSSMSLSSNGASKSITITSNSDCSFTAQSSNESVASVSVAGKSVIVKPFSAGTAYITVGCPSTGRYEAVSSQKCYITVIHDLSYPASANCYVVSRSGEYQFKTVKGNSSVSVGSVNSASVLWESYGTSTQPSKGSVISSVDYSNGYVTFKTPSTLRDGNAVIAVMDYAGNILWSWHIWLCKNFSPDTSGQVYYNNAGVVMDRNLGALSATRGDVRALGLLYQWGRKDPFLGSSNISSSEAQAKSTISWPNYVTSNGTTGTIEYATRNPTTFIAANSLNYDWFYTGTELAEKTRWSSSKTRYDPCPPGWKVPEGGNNGIWARALGSNSPFTGFPYDSSNRGIDFGGLFGSSASIWYPSSGWLSRGKGVLENVGESGYWWSFSPDGEQKVFRLYISNDGTGNPVGSRYRAYGKSIRCVRE